jgi:predicted acylesterase/phospholipase RssA
VATLLASNFSVDDIARLTRDAPWAKLLDYSSCFLHDAYRFCFCFGLCKGEVLREYLESCLYKQFKIRNITFAQLFELTSNELRLGACDVNAGCFMFLDRRSVPDMPVALAATASSAIPLVFQAVPYRSHLFCDGGIMGNLPLNAFPAHATLALELLEEPDDSKPQAPRNVLAYMHRVVDMLMSSAQHVHGSGAQHGAHASVLQIPVPSRFKTLETNVRGVYADALERAAAEAALRFIAAM